MAWGFREGRVSDENRLRTCVRRSRILIGLHRGKSTPLDTENACETLCFERAGKRSEREVRACVCVLRVESQAHAQFYIPIVCIWYIILISFHIASSLCTSGYCLITNTCVSVVVVFCLFFAHMLMQKRLMRLYTYTHTHTSACVVIVIPLCIRTVAALLDLCVVNDRPCKNTRTHMSYIHIHTRLGREIIKIARVLLAVRVSVQSALKRGALLIDQ